jgi:hypothetical protein
MINTEIPGVDTEYPLTRDQIDCYRRDGFIHLPDVITGDALKSLRDAVAGAVATESAASPAPQAGEARGAYEQIFESLAAVGEHCALGDRPAVWEYRCPAGGVANAGLA